MSQPTASLAFFKLNVADADDAERFYVEAFGMERRNLVETATFKEIMLVSPGAPFTLVLYETKGGGAPAAGKDYGPVGFVTTDLDGMLARITAAGAVAKGDVIKFGTARIVFATSPQGHALELLERSR
jgi:predicted enzyme related to lactoylglutathione lyase